jgi:hypothetical protein
MVVRIDISKLPSHLRHALMNEIGLNNRSRKSSSDSNSELSDIDKTIAMIVTLWMKSLLLMKIIHIQLHGR